MIEVELAARAERWMRGSLHCAVVISDCHSVCRERPDLIGWTLHTSYLIEIKTSRSDFKRDQQKFFRRHGQYGMGEMRYFFTEEGLLDGLTLPEGWGWVELRRGDRVFYRARSARHEFSIRDERSLLVSFFGRDRPVRQRVAPLYTLPLFAPKKG